MSDNRFRENVDEAKETGGPPAVLMVRLSFNGPVNDDGLDHFTQLLDEELGHVHDPEGKRVIAKNGQVAGGWGYGSAQVMDVERVKDDE